MDSPVRMRVVLVASLTVVAARVHAAPLAVHVQATSPADYVVEVALDPESVPLVPTLAGGLRFTKVALGSDIARPRAGTPAVPTLHRLLAVEPGQRYEVDVTLEGRTTIDNVLLAPAQPDTLDTGVKSPLVFDAAAYAQDRELGAETVTLGHVAKLGPVSLLPVNITPIHYNPLRRQLTMWKKVTAYLHADGATGELNPARAQLTAFQAAQLGALADNAKAVTRSFAVDGTQRLLVITSQDLLAKAQELSSGGHLPGVTIDYQVVPAGATAQNVKDMVTASYGKGGLNAILLFGDESRVPLYGWVPASGSGPVTPGDSWYAMLQGDSYFDVGLGRLPVHDADEATTILGKLAKYDQLQKSGYINRNVILVANKEDYPQKYTANQEAVRGASNPQGFNFITQYSGAGATNATLAEAINRGAGLISYRGHGDNHSWYDWDPSDASFGADQIKPLSNYDQGLSVVLSIACDTGAIQDTAPSMAETLLLDKSAGGNANHGAVAVVASTIESFTDTNDTFNLYLFNSLESNTHQDLGTLFSTASNRLIRDNNGTLPENVKMYVLYGSPLLKPWID